MLKLMDIYIYILWGPTVSGTQTMLEEARPNVLSEGERVSEDDQQRKK